MRWLVGLAVLLAAPMALAKSSNPAFLGVQMNDLGGAGSGPCRISGVTKDSAAESAGLQEDDIFVMLDGTRIASCDHLISTIQGKVPGDTVKIVVERHTKRVTVDATLLSRDEVLRRRFGGLPVPSVKLVAVDHGRTIDLGTLDNQTTIVGWYPTSCHSCGQVFTEIARWARTQRKRGPIKVYGVTAGDMRMARSVEQNLEYLKPTAKLLDVPLLVAEKNDYDEFTIGDGDRIQLMVIDCRGIVQYAAPLVPDADDKEAVLDELFAAAEQAVRKN